MRREDGHVLRRALCFEVKCQMEVREAEEDKEEAGWEIKCED